MRLPVGACHSRFNTRSPFWLPPGLVSVFASSSSQARLTARSRSLNLSSNADAGTSRSINNVRPLDSGRGAGVVGGAGISGMRSMLRAREGPGGCSRSLKWLSRNAMASAACAFAMPMRAPSSRAGAMSTSLSPSPSNTGSTYVAPSESAGSEVGAPELRRSRLGVHRLCGRATYLKPISGFVMPASTGGKVSSVSRVRVRTWRPLLSTLDALRRYRIS
jgi:hypothetical protein